jgi:alkylhydroperoxidase family enzyme
MAFIADIPAATLAAADRVADPDNIIQIDAIHPVRDAAALRTVQTADAPRRPFNPSSRELLAVRVSVLNQCHY